MEVWRPPPWRSSRLGWLTQFLLCCLAARRALSFWENSQHWACRTRQETHADPKSPKNHLYCTGVVPWECAITGAAAGDQWALSCQNSSFEETQLPWILIRGTALPNLVTKEELESLTPTFTLLARKTWIGKNKWKWESYSTLRRDSCTSLTLFQLLFGLCNPYIDLKTASWVKWKKTK